MFRDANDRPVTASSNADVGVPAQRRRVSREDYAKKPTPCAQCAAPLAYEKAVKYAGKFCTTECQFEYRRGIPSPEECDPNVSRHCERCAAPLNRLQISRKAKHCGESCRHEAWVDKAREERKSAAPHSGLDYQKQPMQCVVCGTPLTWGTVAKYTLRYCGNDCRNQAMSGKCKHYVKERAIGVVKPIDQEEQGQPAAGTTDNSERQP